MRAAAASRLVAGVSLGAASWFVLELALPHLPPFVRFTVSWLVFTAGPGLALSSALTRGEDWITKAGVALACGSAAAAVLIDVFGRLGVVVAFPHVAAGLAGGSVARLALDGSQNGRPSRFDLVSIGVLVALAIGTGSVAFSNRLVETGREIRVHGDYDSLDLAYYASITSEATHTIPPSAPYYAGRELNYAYYPQLVPSMIHRFADVPVLDMYFGYAWPTSLAVAVLMGFVLVRAIASSKAALLAMLFLLLAGDFSYLFAWWRPQPGPEWDYVLWPTNFLAPTMEVLHFNSWTPTLPIFFVTLFAIARATNRGGMAWAIVGGLTLATLFQFKPFAFLVLGAALAATVLFSWRHSHGRNAIIITLLTGSVMALPFVYRALALYADRRSELVLSPFVLPQRMLIKLNLSGEFATFAERWSPTAAIERPFFLGLATLLFLAVGPAVRWIAAPRIVRALAGREDPAIPWRLLSWIVVAGTGIPFIIATEPYHDTLQFYQVGLYVWWIFAGATLAALIDRHRMLGIGVAALALVVSLPSSFHYLDRKWHDETRPPLARLGRSEIAIAEYLRTRDPDTTAVLHGRPFDPSLLPVVSERRVVLAWARYAVGSDDRRRDVDAFFASEAGSPDFARDVLRRYRVSHVIYYPGRDHVHSDVLRELNPTMTFPDVVLYTVPDALRATAP